jgi:hypothetical protein
VGESVRAHRPHPVLVINTWRLCQSRHTALRLLHTTDGPAMDERNRSLQHQVVRFAVRRRLEEMRATPTIRFLARLLPQIEYGRCISIPECPGRRTHEDPAVRVQDSTAACGREGVSPIAIVRARCCCVLLYWREKKRGSTDGGRIANATLQARASCGSADLRTAREDTRNSRTWVRRRATR